MSSKPVVLVLGHSFVRRLVKFTQNRTESTATDMGLRDSCTVVYHGISGGRLSHLWDEIDFIANLSPQIVILDVGTNDLASSSSPGNLANAILAFANHLHVQCKVRVIYIAHIFPRAPHAARTPPDFNERAHTYNAALKSLCTDSHTTIFSFYFTGLIENWPAYLLHDGVHLSIAPPYGFSHSGTYKYFRAIKTCVVFALRML
jgi:hypothetical protein